MTTTLRTHEHTDTRLDVLTRRSTGRRRKHMVLTLAAFTTALITTAGVSSSGAASHNVSYSVVPSRTLVLTESGTVAIGSIGRSATISGVDGGLLGYTTDVTSDKITVSSSAMEPNTTLKVTAGSIGTCTGTKGTLETMPLSLTTTAQDLITGIGTTGTGNCISSLTYALTTAGATVASDVSKTVTYTIQAA